MKLQLAIASGNTLDVEIRPDDTFKSLIARTLEESGIKLQLFHFGLAGKKIKYTDNVANYFVGPAPPEDELCSYFPAQLCRLCAKPGDNMKFIFQDHDLEESINTWLPTYVSETDLLPKQVCVNCVEQLEMCKTFQIDCVQAEVTLKDLLKSEKVSLSKEPVKKPVEETSGPKVFECGFVYGQRGSANIDKSVKKSLSQDFCCPLCHEGSMAKAVKHVSDDLNRRPNLSEINVVLGEIKLEPLEEYDFDEEPSFVDFTQVGEMMPVIKSETELGFADEEEVTSFSEIDNLETIEDKDQESASTAIKYGLREKRSYPCPKQATASSQVDIEKQIPAKVIHKNWISENGTSDVISDKLQFKCTICEEGMGSMDDLLEHSFELHSSTEFFPCPFCPLAFDMAPQLMSHFAVKHNPSSRGEENKEILLHRCDKCYVYFPSNVNLSKHKCAENLFNSDSIAKKTNRTVDCPTCGKSLKSKTHLEFHMQFHMEGTKPLYCHICHEDFETEESMYKHFRWFHNDQEPKCSICDKSFANYNTLIIHKKLHTNIRKYQCGTCLKTFIDKQTLAEHIVTHMDTTPYQCPICQKYLARNSRLKQHMLIHEIQDKGPQEIYDCTVCRQVFPSEKAAIKHGGKCHENSDNKDAAFGIVVVNKVLRCEFCSQNYATMEVLNEHRATHTGLKKFSCQFCTATFESFARRTSHKLKHGGSKESENKHDRDEFTVPLHYVCNECDQTYFLWSYLTIHKKQKHSEVQCMHNCKMCSESFENSWSLAYHRKSKHGQVTQKNSWWGKAARIHECLHCDKLFASQLLLAKHQMFHHPNVKKRTDGGNRVQCDTCGKTFVKQAYLDKHMKMHAGVKSEQCRHCGRSFVHESSLKKHLKTHSSRFPYQCTFCQKRFLMKHDLEVHTRRHTGYKPHKCEACDKCFRTKSMLVQHIRIHTNERPYPCDMCELAFRRSWALKNHKRIHTGQKPFCCELCQKAFRLKQDLTTHLARVHSAGLKGHIDIDLTNE